MGWLLKLLGLGTGFNPIVLAIVAAVIFTAGATSGWTLNGWRLGGEVATLKGEKAVLEGNVAVLTDANATCKANVADVRAALAKFYQAQETLAETVRAAIAKAAPQAAEHLRRAEELLARAAVPQDQWCATIIKEQGEAVKLRRSDRMKSMEGK